MVEHHIILRYNKIQLFRQTGPDRTGPDQTRPDQTRPVQTRPDQSRPDQTRPDLTRQTDDRCTKRYLNLKTPKNTGILKVVKLLASYSLLNNGRTEYYSSIQKIHLRLLMFSDNMNKGCTK